MNNAKVLSQLSLHQLTTILADDNLNIDNEVLGWWAVIAWISYSPTERLVHFWDLFLLVSCQLMHSSILKFQMANDFWALNAKHNYVLCDKKVLASKFAVDNFLAI